MTVPLYFIGWKRTEQALKNLAGWGPREWRGDPRGIGYAHLSLWNHIYEQGYPETLICEDDVVLLPNFKIPKRSEQIILLGVLESGQTLTRKVSGRRGWTICPRDIVFGNHCYLIKRSCLPLLLSEFDPAGSPLDIQLFERFFHTGRISYVLHNPTMAYQEGNDASFR